MYPGSAAQCLSGSLTQALMMSSRLVTLLGPAGAGTAQRPDSPPPWAIHIIRIDSESDHAAAVAARAVTNGPGPGIH